ncbi:uncharacterized protein LOC131942639 [Physella acuta]|uniref:uncharacterized protein LOC131942639 n=1 Tax=Physella acuta TaxID=109671 RepID=UPI0027DC2D55|nr:uncharacterized protein LOC131942639 [Physella acuta]
MDTSKTHQEQMLQNTSELQQLVLTDTSQYIVDVYIITVGSTLVAILGIIANVINQVVFAKIGFRTSMNLSLFILSSSDCFMGCCTIAYNVCRISRIFPTDSIIDYKVPQRAFAYARIAFTDFSSAITIYISIERCLCVTFPFTFKSMFTMKQTLITLFSIILFYLANELPLFWTMCVELKYDITRHFMRYFLCETTLHNEVVMSNDIIFGLIMSSVCQFSSAFCGIVMYRALQKSSTIRTAGKNHFLNSETPNANSLSVKEKRLVKMVLLLVILYIPTSLPNFIIGWVRLFYPEIFSWTVSNLFNFYTLNNLVNLFGNIHGAITILIYAGFNPAYRQYFVFVRCRKMKAKEKESQVYNK